MLALRVAQLALHVGKLQNRCDVPYFPRIGPPFPPVTWQSDKGNFPSDIKVRVGGKLQPIQLLANVVSIPDNNCFVPTFVAQFLAEAKALQPCLPVPEPVISNAVRCILEYRDKNNRAGQADSSLFGFWRQTAENEGLHVAAPPNLVIPMKQVEGFATAAEGIARRAQLNIDGNPVLENLLAGPTEGLKAFGIPPDFDDSFVVQALLGQLAQVKDTYPKAYELLSESVAHPPVDHLVRYAYRPLSSDKQQSTIDSRTYYWLRDFIQETKQRAAPGTQPTLSLATTWAQNMDGSAANWHKGESMPGGVNNVDGSVATNVLFGLTSRVLLDGARVHSELPAWFNEDVEAIYGDTARLVTWIVDKDLLADESKAKAILLYYPSTYDFFHFVGRLSHLLENPPGGEPLADVLEQARTELTAAMRGKGTQHLLERAQRDGRLVFWSDKLKNNADSVFTTAAAVNALLDVWTRDVPVSDPADARQPQANGVRRCWVEGVPPEVVQTVQDATWFLQKYADPRLDLLPKEGAFFSASTGAGLALDYPCNVRELADGTPLEQGGAVPISVKLGSQRRHGVAGVIPNSDYERMLGETGIEAGTKDLPVPFWSSPPVTYALSLLALAKFAALEPQ